MDFLMNISSKKHTLTKSELKAHDNIVANLMLVQRYSLTKLSEHIGVSKTSILRFCQKIGYSGYSEFRFDCIKYVNKHNKIESIGNKRSDKIVAVQNKYIQTINLLNETIDEKELLKLVHELKSARLIRCVGEINSAVTCYQLRYALSMYGYNVDVLTSSSEVTSVDLATSKDDLILLISAQSSAESDLLNETMRLAEDCGAKLALVTMNPNSVAFKKANISIQLPNIPSIQGNSLLENVPLFSIFVQILLSFLD